VDHFRVQVSSQHFRQEQVSVNHVVGFAQINKCHVNSLAEGGGDFSSSIGAFNFANIFQEVEDADKLNFAPCSRAKALLGRVDYAFRMVRAVQLRCKALQDAQFEQFGNCGQDCDGADIIRVREARVSLAERDYLGRVEVPGPFMRLLTGTSVGCSALLGLPT